MTFQIGETVDIHIKNARVTNTYPTSRDGQDTGLVVVADLGGDLWSGRNVAVNTAHPGVTVEHVASADWPPQPGDVWREAHPDGATWFAQRYFPDYDNSKDRAGINADGWRIVMVPLNGGDGGCSEQRPEVLMRRVKLALVYREPADPDPDTAYKAALEDEETK